MEIKSEKVNSMFRCSCGEEHSYGKKIFHQCQNNTQFFGAIFKEHRKDHNWNYMSHPLEKIKSGQEKCIDCEKQKELKRILELLNQKYSKEIKGVVRNIKSKFICSECELDKK